MFLYQNPGDTRDGEPKNGGNVGINGGVDGNSETLTGRDTEKVGLNYEPKSTGYNRVFGKKDEVTDQVGFLYH